MRTLYRLYKIVQQSRNNRDDKGPKGICAFIYLSDMNDKCKDRLLEHFLANKPTNKLHSEFYYHESFIGKFYWWNKNHPEAEEQRTKFIMKMIDITRPT